MKHGPYIPLGLGEPGLREGYQAPATAGTKLSCGYSVGWEAGGAVSDLRSVSQS